MSLSPLFRNQIEENADFSCDRLVCGTAELMDNMTIEEAGIDTESTLNALISLDGGKRKRKKKVHTTPKRIAHKHRKRPLALLEYFSVENSGKVKKLKQECDKCPVGK